MKYIDKSKLFVEYKNSLDIGKPTDILIEYLNFIISKIVITLKYQDLNDRIVCSNYATYILVKNWESKWLISVSNIDRKLANEDRIYEYYLEICKRSLAKKWLEIETERQVFKKRKHSLEDLIWN